MTLHGFTVLSFIFSWGWRFFTGFHIPGTNITPGAILLFAFLTSIILNFARRLFGVEQIKINKGDE